MRIKVSNHCVLVPVGGGAFDLPEQRRLADAVWTNDLTILASVEIRSKDALLSFAVEEISCGPYSTAPGEGIGRALGLNMQREYAVQFGLASNAPKLNRRERLQNHLAPLEHLSRLLGKIDLASGALRTDA